MAYRDPYNEQLGRSPSQHQHQYNESAADYNPYSTSRPPHQTYDQGEIGPSYDNYGSGYKDEPQVHGGYAPERHVSQRTYNGGLGGNHDAGAFNASKESSQDAEGFAHASPPGERTARALRNYRYDHQGYLWTKGGRGRCVGRFCCCTIMVALLLIISIGLTLALWIRPPNITIGDVDTVAKGGSGIQLQESGISINLGVNISVDNPNYFSVNFNKIKAEIFYPINDTSIGSGEIDNLVFGSHSQKNFTFPFTIDYETARDPQRLILLDLAKKCGVLGEKSNISVSYKITLGLRILIIPISPVVTNTFTFMCPIDADAIAALGKSAGINIGDLIGS